jgi:hypothetical protein
MRDMDGRESEVAVRDVGCVSQLLIANSSKRKLNNSTIKCYFPHAFCGLILTCNSNE